MLLNLIDISWVSYIQHRISERHFDIITWSHLLIIIYFDTIFQNILLRRYNISEYSIQITHPSTISMVECPPSSQWNLKILSSSTPEKKTKQKEEKTVVDAFDSLNGLSYQKVISHILPEESNYFHETLSYVSPRQRSLLDN